VIAKVAMEPLSEEVDRMGLLGDGQFGYRKGWSAINAAAIMDDRAPAAWTNGHITAVHLMDIKAASPSVAKGRLVNLMQVRQMDGDLVRWTKSFQSETTVEMIIEGNAMERHPVEAVVPQGSLMSPIDFAIYTSGLIKSVEENVPQAERLFVVDVPGLVVTGNHDDHVVSILERCATKSIEWASRRGLQFDTSMTEAALFTRSHGDRKHLRPKLTAMIRVRNGSIQFTEQGTRWLGVWIDAHLTFKDHHNRCMTLAKRAEVRLRSLTKTYGVVPESIWDVEVACVQAVVLYGSELWFDPRAVGRRDDLQLLIS
jgi:hypothetical protein